ncbi:MAG: 50S ribosomal protein L30 [Deltaproteobacteria bacterium]|nr:50S ribosomal protein L30 [Deltaproteobacteria bacterium]
MGKIRITQIRSALGREPNQRKVIKALGLRRINHTVEHANTPTIRGMVKKVLHLVRFEETA